MCQFNYHLFHNAANLMRLRCSRDVNAELQSLEKSPAKGAYQTTLLMAFRDRSLRFPMIIGVAMQVAQQLSGW